MLGPYMDQHGCTLPLPDTALGSHSCAPTTKTTKPASTGTARCHCAMSAQHPPACHSILAATNNKHYQKGHPIEAQQQSCSCCCSEAPTDRQTDRRSTPSIPFEQTQREHDQPGQRPQLTIPPHTGLRKTKQHAPSLLPQPPRPRPLPPAHTVHHMCCSRHHSALSTPQNAGCSSVDKGSCGLFGEQAAAPAATAAAAAVVPAAAVPAAAAAAVPIKMHQ